MTKIIALTNGTKKGQIVKSAAALFRQKGFRAASVRELAESLGIEAPSLYNHIGSKGELLQEICFGVAKDFTEHMLAVLATKESAADKTAALIRFHIRKMYTDFDKVYVSDNEWKQLQKKPAEVFLSQRRAYENSLTEIIEEGIRKKQFRKMNPRITMLTILSAVRGPEFRQRHKKEFSVTEVEDNMIQHLLNGIIR
ncbi:MAG: TetR/AcrR family transcriptional regulator [Ferruginibacter sp.]